MAAHTETAEQLIGRTTRARHRRECRFRCAAASLLVLGALACSGPTDEGKLPPDIPDPTAQQTPSGALARYHGALAQLPEALDRFMTETGILTDELADLPAPFGLTGIYTDVDSRTDLSKLSDNYSRLHDLRAQAREARGFVRAYAPDSSAALAGHLYALEGYAEVLLADLFCSGIPLSTVDFGGDYTLQPGSSTADVYRHAAALFDSAMAITSDSARIQYLAAVGRGRALLALGQYTDAAAAVAAVPDGYTYQVVFDPLNNPMKRLLWWFIYTGTDVPSSDFTRGDYAHVNGTPSVADDEGVNGLDYRSSGDPRILDTILGTDQLGNAMHFSLKYSTSGPVTLTVADAIEARLIEAEALLKTSPDDGQWLAKLNALRTSGSALTIDTVTDTLGVTQCGDGWPICGASPGGSDNAMGQPTGGFQPPAGFTLVDSFTINLADHLDVYNDCYANSYYEPCYGDLNNAQPGTTKVLVYTAPPVRHWRAGTGGVAELPMLEDPGTAEGRLDLLFRERAFWLYLTGHRQGDLRRLVRNYGRSPNAVYPTDIYPGGPGHYGNEVVVPVPDTERDLNPKYAGCFNRGA